MQSEGLALLGTGQALASLGQAEEAMVVYAHALAIQRGLGQHHAVLQTLSALAAVTLAQAWLAAALSVVDEILTILATSTLLGVNEPMQIYLTCYQVLQANHDLRAAELLRQAYHCLQTQVATIDNTELCQSFLEQVAVNRQIMAAYIYHDGGNRC